MLILKLSTDDKQEREVEIIDEKGTWKSGNYHLFEFTTSLKNDGSIPEPHTMKSPDFLGEMNINKEIGKWEYIGNKLAPDEQKQIGNFILDYTAPDGGY